MEQLLDIVKTLEFKRRSAKRQKIIGKSGYSLCLGYEKMISMYTCYTKPTLNQFDKYKQILDWGEKNLPEDFKFNCVYVNKNTKADKHKDIHNVGNSYFLYMGDCDGGELNIYDTEDEDKIIHKVKKNELYKFNGYENYHETCDFSGDRYSIIFYKNYYYDEFQKIKDYVICIPSHKRAQICNDKTLTLLHNHGIDRKQIFVFVDKPERKEYMETLDKKKYNRIVNGKKGLIPQKRFIKSIYPEGQRILMLDDDLEKIDLSLSHEFSEYTLDKFIKNGFEECEKTDTYLWGIYPVWNDWFRKQRKERRTNLAFIIGYFTGVINRYDDDLKYIIDSSGNMEDIQNTIVHYLKDRKVLRFDRVGIKTKFYSKGGLGLLKDRIEERGEVIHYLLEKYPYIGRKKIRKNGNPELVLKANPKL